MVVTSAGILTLVTLVTPKEELPIVVILVGIITLVMLAPQKAVSPIPNTATPPIVEGIIISVSGPMNAVIVCVGISKVKEDSGVG